MASEHLDGVNYNSNQLADSRSYSGNWEFGKQHGYGEYTNTSSLKRKGEWVNGKRVKWCD